MGRVHVLGRRLLEPDQTRINIPILRVIVLALVAFGPSGEPTSEMQAYPRIGLELTFERIHCDHAESNLDPVMQQIRVKAGSLTSLQGGMVLLIHEGEHVFGAKVVGAFGDQALPRT